jgi:hypothetical protein
MYADESSTPCLSEPERHGPHASNEVELHLPFSTTQFVSYIPDKTYVYYWSLTGAAEAIGGGIELMQR